MVRLPIPGQDQGTWGDILNEYLSQSHNSDGTLKPIAQSQVVSLTSALSSKASATDLSALDARVDSVELALPTKATQAALQTEIDERTAQAATFATEDVAFRQRHRPGEYYASPHGSTTTGLVGTGGALRAAPFLVGKIRTFDRIAVEVITAAAGGLIRLGIYADDGTGYPGTLTIEAGAVDSATTGLKEIAISQTLTPGTYWLTSMGEVANATTRIFAGQSLLMPIATTTNQTYFGWSANGITGGALPIDYPTGAALAATVAKIMVRAA